MTMDDECLTFGEALKRLCTDGAPVSSAALYALSAPSSLEVQLFRGRWPTATAERRRRMLTLLTESAEGNFELDFNALFRVTMEDEDEQVRTLSIEGLWEDEEASLVGPLVRVLRHDTGASARAAAAASLGRFALLGELDELETRYRRLVRGVLLEAVYDEDEDLDVRRRAVESIAYLSEECVRDIISAAYDEAEERMRISAVFAMGRSADTYWSEIVQRELGNDNPAMRYEAARACGEIEVKNAVPELIRLASGPDREVQYAAIGSLGQIGGPQAKVVLGQLARSDDEVLRMMAEDALAELELGEQPLDLMDFRPDVVGEADEDEEEIDDNDGELDEDEEEPSEDE